jgi:hypothetical protein
MHTSNLSKITGLVVILLFFVPKDSFAQVAPESRAKESQQEIPARYNFEEFAIALALNAGREASNLSSPAEKIEIQLEAARILSPVRRDDALRLLDSAWNTLKEWSEGEKSTSAQSRPQFVSRLRSNILALYSKLDPERAGKLMKSVGKDLEESVKKGDGGKGNALITKERQRADDLARIGLTRIERSPAEGIETAVSGLLQTGTVSEHLSLISQALKEKGKASLLQKFESRIAAFLSQRTSLDFSDHLAVVRIIYANPHMDRAVRSSFLGFLSHSLVKLREIIREAQVSKQALAISLDSVGSIYSFYMLRVRPLVISYGLNDIYDLNVALDEIASTLPASLLDKVYETSTTDTPEQQLKRALNTAGSELRDSRLAKFALRALNGSLHGIKESQPELAATAVESVSSLEIKTTLQDYLLMAHAEKLSKDNKFALAEEKAAAISKPEWRAWTLMALASAQAKQNWSHAMQLCDDALRALEKSSPTPRKAELAFTLADIWSGHDQNQALDIIVEAVKYANQIIETDLRIQESPSVLQPFFLNIGKLSFAPGIETESLSDIGFHEGISQLALLNWMRADQIGKALQNANLRLRYQLAICKGVLNKVKVDKRTASND